MIEILNELKNTTSTKEKFNLLMKNKENETLKRILKYAYDSVSYTYGVTYNHILSFESNDTSQKNMFELLEELSKRELTGHNALRECKNLINSLTEIEKIIFKGIIDRDFKIGVSTKTLNKVWKGLIPTPNYCRCSVFKKGANISYPAYVQLKCDGTYREAHIENGVCSFRTRSGEEYSIPTLEKEMSKLPDGYYTGEFTIGKADEPDVDRQVGNGLINSKTPPFEKIHFTIWDYLRPLEYTLNERRIYKERFEELTSIIAQAQIKNVSIVQSVIVNSEEEMMHQVSLWMSKGLEGGVLKDFNMSFKNGTSNQQFKIKLKIDTEMRVKGFQKGTEGTKYEGQNKVIIFENDEGTIKGQCSGMSDAQVEECTKHPEKYIGKIVSVQFNDLIKAQGSEVYALSHPRFVEFRINEKNETDTLEKVLDLREMAKNL